MGQALAGELGIELAYAQKNGLPLARVHVQIAPPYHAYAHVPGPTGKPTVLRLASAAGPSTVLYPLGIAQKDIFDPRQTVRVYEGSVSLYVELPEAKGGQEYTGQLDALLCSDKHCLPLTQTIVLRWPSGAVHDLPDVSTLPWAADYAAAEPGEGGAGRAGLAAGTGVAINAGASAGSSVTAGSGVPIGTGVAAGGSGTGSQAPALKALPLLPLGKGGIPASSLAEANRATSRAADTPGATGAPDAPGAAAVPDASGAAVVPDVSDAPLVSDAPSVSDAPDAAGAADVSGALPWNLVPRYFENFSEVSSLGKALLLGLLAGLLLNVMPCVLPVLTMKGSAILLMGSGDAAERFRRFREHSLLFAAGIMTLFLFLALVLGMAGMMWGQLFQNPHVILGMLLLVFLLGLSMLGVFTLPILDLKASQGGSPRTQAYLTGIMATLLATPCSGPLLGGVLGWAFIQPLPVLITVFLAVGLGMCVPYILFAIRPQLVTLLPKPGPWMGILERLVGFFLLGTSVYLLSILPTQQYIPVLAVLLLVALCAWVYGYFGSLSAPEWRRRLLALGSVLLVGLSLYLSLWSPAPPTRWESFDPASFQQILGKEPLLLEFTADWCPNCKLLEQSTLTEKNLRRWQQRYGLRLVRVDITRENPPAQALLRALGSSSIPLTALFPAGSGAHSPLVLRDLYSTESMDKALRETFLP